MTTPVFKAFAGLLHCSLFLVVFELATATSYYGMEASLLLTGLLFLFVLLERYGLHPMAAIRELCGSGTCFAPLWLPVSSYLLWDAVTCLYSPAPVHIWSKYKVVLLMLFLSVALRLYLSKADRINSLLWTVTASGFAAAVLSVSNHLLPLFEQHYRLRLSLRVDYNMFAAVLFTALLVASFLICKGTLSFGTKAALLCCVWVGLLPVIFLSSSRRTFLLVLPTVLLLLGLFGADNFKKVASKKLVLALGGMLAVTVLCSVAVSSLLNVYMEATYQAKAQKGEAQVGESAVAQRYEALAQSSSTSKRSILWRVAWEEYRSFPAAQKMVGKGASYNILLYDLSQDNALQAAYPNHSKVEGLLCAHNFVLADLLDGGLVKAVLGIGVWMGVAWTMLVLLRSYPVWGWLYALNLGFALVNNLISNRYGFLYDKLFWIFCVLATAEVGLIKQDKRRIEQKWRG